MRNRLPFQDRDAAAHQLADALQDYRGCNPLVLAIPRGAVPMAQIIAAGLDGQFDIVQVRKLGAPGNPELAIGAIDESGRRYVADYAAELGASPAYLDHVAERELNRMRQRRVSWMGGRQPIDPRDRVVIVVDDGLATGASMIAALRSVRAQRPAQLICAIPVAAIDSLPHVQQLADQVVCLAPLQHFGSVGEHYRDFRSIEDSDVARLLQKGGASGPVDAGASSTLQIRTLQIQLFDATLAGDLARPADPAGMVVFAHGSGSNRHSARNRQVAQALNAAGLATLLLDLQQAGESSDSVGLQQLSERLSELVVCLPDLPGCADLPIGLFGGSTGATVALAAAAAQPRRIAAVVSRGGRIDLLDARQLAAVAAPTLLIVGGADVPLLQLNRQALTHLGCRAELQVVAGAGHLFEEADALDQVARLSVDWFRRWMPAPSAIR